MLAAEQAHGVSAGTQECDVSLLTHFHKLGALAKEAIAWMHGIAPASQITLVSMVGNIWKAADMLLTVHKWVFA